MNFIALPLFVVAFTLGCNGNRYEMSSPIDSIDLRHSGKVTLQFLDRNGHFIPWVWVELKHDSLPLVKCQTDQNGCLIINGSQLTEKVTLHALPATQVVVKE